MASRLMKDGKASLQHLILRRQPATATATAAATATTTLLGVVRQLPYAAEKFNIDDLLSTGRSNRKLCPHTDVPDCICKLHWAGRGGLLLADQSRIEARGRPVIEDDHDEDEDEDDDDVEDYDSQEVDDDDDEFGDDDEGSDFDVEGDEK